jgi:hypothetical protein
MYSEKCLMSVAALKCYKKHTEMNQQFRTMLPGCLTVTVADTEAMVQAGMQALVTYLKLLKLLIIRLL